MWQRRQGRGAFRVLLCLLVLTLPVFGSKHPPNSLQEPGSIHVTTRLVQISVIVKDQRGQLVTWLRESDFRIFDNGVAQGISDFEAEQSGASSALQPLPPDIFSNVPERQAGGSPAVTIILLDGLNTTWEDQTRSTQQVIKFLRQIQPGDRVAIYALGTRLVMLHDFTSDSATLVRALARSRGRPNTEVKASQADDADNPPEWADDVNQMSSDIPNAAITSGVGEFVKDATEEEALYSTDQRVAMTTDALVGIADHLQGVPGRKNLIWVSGAFPLLRGINDLDRVGDIGKYQVEVERAAQALSDANLAVYPVDARGLMVDPNFAVPMGPPNPRAYARMRQLRLPAHLTENFPTMDEMAKRTGGRAFYDTNDIQGAIRRVIDDSRLTYRLGYYPMDTVWDGKFHNITVRVDRPGLKLQYRNGYAAVPEQPVTAPSAQQSLSAAVLSPLDATGVAVVIKATPLKSAAGASQSVMVQYWINPRDITLTRDGQNWAVRITVVLDEMGPQGQSLKGLSHKFDFDLNPNTRKNFLQYGLRYNEPLAIVPQAERLRVVVRDDPTGAVGSVSVPLDRVFARPRG